MRTILAMILAGMLALSVEGSAEEKRTADIFAMDTHISMTAYGENAAGALEEAKSLLAEYEQLWSVTMEESEIAQINRADGEWVAVSEETADILEYALDMAQYTEGCYDPTIYPLVAAWGFTTDAYRIPGAEELRERITLVDYRKLTVGGGKAALPAGMQIDLGGIAKGYAGDRVAALLKQKEIDSAIISLGGNIHVLGSKPDGSAWKIGIKSPLGDGMLGALSVRDRCVITSGAYERYFEGEDGKKYGHIIDPDTGMPADNGVLSVTVVGEEGAQCDALSTALFVMGAEEACAFWKAHEGFEMVILTDEKILYVTEGLDDSFEAWESELIDEVCRVER